QIQFVEPLRGGIVLGKEGAIDQFRTATLEESEDKPTGSIDVEDAVDGHLPPAGGHDRATDRATQTRDLAIRLGEYPMCGNQWNRKVFSWTSIPLHEHIIRHHAQSNLGPPHARPQLGCVVHAADERALRADDRSGLIDPCDRLKARRRFELTWVRKM